MNREEAVPMLRWTRVCDECRQAAMVNRSGACSWCGSPTRPITVPRHGPFPGCTPQEAITLHGFCVTENVSVRVAVSKRWQGWGYSSATTCARAIENTWRTMGLPTPNPDGVGAHRRGEATATAAWDPVGT